MFKNSPNWIAFYTRHGEDVSLTFRCEGRPTLADVVAKIRRRPELVELVMPYTECSIPLEAKAQAFLEANNIEGLVYTPFVESKRNLRS